MTSSRKWSFNLPYESHDATVAHPPHRPVNQTFTAKYHGSCPRCGDPILPGETVRYSPDDDLVHNRHTQREVVDVVDVVCPACFMTKPCWC